MQFVILWSDFFIFIITILSIGLVCYLNISKQWLVIAKQPIAILSFVVLMYYLIIGLLDSIHFRYQSNEIISLFDYMITPLGRINETSYSAPFAVCLDSHGLHSAKNFFLKTITKIDYIGASFLVIFAGVRYLYKNTIQKWNEEKISWIIFFSALFIMTSIFYIAFDLSAHYHILGTDKVGLDVFYQSLKSIRTGLIIGLITNFVVLPFAIGFGISSGYFGGFIDDIIQYIYTTLSSIPGVLLISAAVLSMQVFIANHAQHFTTIAQRADARLLVLCIILGMTGWTPLCRLLRGEAMKLRQMDFVVAAVALGVSPIRIIFKHILPNVMHIIIITLVLDFSSLVLAEAVLSYVGVGVDPTTISWGNIINSARLELAREPIVWWPLCSAFLFMFVLVMAVNLFADRLREALEPKH